MRLLVVICLLIPGVSLGQTNPDFTKGGSIPSDAKHDWNLGPTGARGWMHTEHFVTSLTRQIYITKVEKGSPAASILQVGDVILGVGGKLFSYDPRTEMGKAINTAEKEENAGALSLIRWRDGESKHVVLRLSVLGSYSAAAPYDCPKSQRIFEQGCEALAKRVDDPTYARTQNPITRSLNALALLASGNKKYERLIKKEAQWAADYSADSMQSWYYGYVIMFLSEYKLSTDDNSIMPGLERLALETAKGQSMVGSWGHGFANPDGRLGGYGMMNSPGLPLTIGLVLAREAGVKDPVLDRAIERSAKLYRFYIGKGGVPYGDHEPWVEDHTANGKCGMAAVLFNSLSESNGVQFFSHMSTAAHGYDRDTGHCGNFFNLTWAMPSIALSGPHATGAWMQEFGSWYFDLARRWDGSFDHLGPPEKYEDSYVGWDCSGAYLLAYAMPLKKTFFTGKKKSIIPQLSAKAARSVVADGRGWSKHKPYEVYDKLSDEWLLKRLSNWSPVVRERAAIAVSRRKGKAMLPQLITMLKSPQLESRYGACQALIALGGRAAAAVKPLRETLKADDLWLRIKAAEALASIGKPAMKAVPDLLELLAKVDKKNDPRGMQQRYLSYALFYDEQDGMLHRSLKDVDRDLLYKAVRAGLKNEDGRARGAMGSVYRNLSYEEIKPLLPAIYQAIVEPAPSGIMFACVSRTEGLKILAKHGIEEGIQACVDYTRKQNGWWSEGRTPIIMEALLTYGKHAQSVIPQLENIAADFADGEPDFPMKLSKQKAAAVRDTIKAIQASKENPELISIE